MIEKNANIPDVLYALFLPFRKPDVPFLEHNVRYLPKNFRMYFLPRRCMNKPNTDLFELIKSMSAAEKGYFKKFSAKHSIGGGNAYLTLFDAIDRMSEYREDLLKKRFAKEGFVKRLPAAKNYLMKILLESLRSFHSESSVEREILGMLVDIGILWRRNIRTQARKLTEKALEMAEKYENWELALAVLYWMQIVQPSEQGSIGYKDLSAVFQKQQDIAARLLAENQYSEFARLLSSYTGTGSFHADNQPDTIKELMANPMLQDENLAATVQAKQMFHHVHVIYNTYVLHDDAKALYHSSRRFNTLNSAQHIVESKPKLFLYAAHQHAQRLLMNKYFDECAYILGRIKDLIRTNEEHYPAFAVDAVPLYLSLDVLFHINTARIAEGAKKVPQWQALYQKVGADLEENFQRAIPFNIALLLFLNHDYAQALRWVQIVTQCNDEYYPAIGTAARLMTLCIHVELGNESLLADYARSIQRYLQKQGAIHLPERAILAMFRATAAKELSDAELRSLLETLQNIPKNAKENSSLQLFDVELWLQSRLEGKSLVNLIKERFLS